MAPTAKETTSEVSGGDAKSQAEALLKAELEQLKTEEASQQALTESESSESSERPGESEGTETFVEPKAEESSRE